MFLPFFQNHVPSNDSLVNSLPMHKKCLSSKTLAVIVPVCEALLDVGRGQSLAQWNHWVFAALAPSALFEPVDAG